METNDEQSEHDRRWAGQSRRGRNDHDRAGRHQADGENHWKNDRSASRNDHRDLAGFGRRAIDVPLTSLTNEVIYQIGTLDGFARVAGTRVRYVKPHAALYNRIVHDEAQAAAAAAVQAYDPSLPVLGLPGSAWLRLAAEAGLTTVGEAFADRGYTPSATLVPRSQPGALLTGAAEVADRVVRMVTEGVVRAVDGSDIELAARSICVHGDSPDAVGMARAIRAAILDRGITLEAFT